MTTRAFFRSLNPISSFQCPYRPKGLFCEIEWVRSTYELTCYKTKQTVKTRLSIPHYVCPTDPNHGFDTVDTLNVEIFAKRKRALKLGLINSWTKMSEEKVIKELSKKWKPKN